MPISFELKVDGNAIDNIMTQLNRFPDQIQKAAQQTVIDLQPVKSDLAKSVGRVKYPIQWTSERQRRAFFATNGFGAGIPYVRTGRLNAAWYVDSVTSSDGAEITIGNKSRIAQYVYGTFTQPSPQQRFHKNTGWQTINEDQKRILNLMVAKFLDNIVIV